MKRIVPLTLALSILSVTACADSSMAPDARSVSASDAPNASATSLEHSSAPFKTWHQGFQHGTRGWVTDDVAGPAGWCGDIEQVAAGEGSLAPSAGRAHAIVREGACNAFHQGRGFLTSGPASGFQPLNRAFPVGGYVQEMDIHLDPDWSNGTGFGYVVSFQNLAYQIPASFRYLMVPVMKQEGALAVGGHEITDAGWYTFRHRFYDDDGTLGVELNVLQGGHVVTTVPLSETPSMFWSETPSSLDASNTGSGYIWFSSITDGLDLPIDEQQLRRGR